MAPAQRWCLRTMAQGLKPTEGVERRLLSDLGKMQVRRRNQQGASSTILLPCAQVLNISSAITGLAFGGMQVASAKVQNNVPMLDSVHLPKCSGCQSIAYFNLTRCTA